MIDFASLLLAAALGVAPPAPAASAPPLSAQATYDAAQAAYDKGDWRAAITGFSRLVPPAGAAPLSRSTAMIASRLAYALLKVNRLAEARALALRAAAALSASPSDAGEAADAWQTAGDAERFSYAYPAAVEAYGHALASAVAAGAKGAQLRARVGSAEALMTLDPTRADAEMGALLGDQDLVGALPKPQLAQLVDLQARAQLNAGDTTRAAGTIERAIDLSGGLTTTNVSTSQVAIRNDAALIYGLRHDDDMTRKYLGYTGAGHLKAMDWIGAFEGDLPVCGEGGVTPEDVAVVQFAIDRGGDVMGAAPIYVSRPGEMGAVFGRTVNTWRWDPDKLKAVDPFWRNTLVLQLRCQTRPTPESLGAPVYAALARWLNARGVETSVNALLQPVAADDPRLKADGPAALAALLQRYGHTHGEEAAAAARIGEVLAANQAPASAYAIFYVAAAARHSQGDGLRGGARASAQALAQTIPLLKARFPEDIAVAWVELQRALDLETAGDFHAAAPVLAEVLATPTAVLPEEAPIRRVALLHAGLVARRLHQPAAAEAQVAASGLNAEQCSMFDTHPILYGHSISGSDYPEAAYRWGFEGYVREAFDIKGDGTVDHVRTVVAYPPFLFDRSSELAARTFRFVPPTINGRSVGCTGEIKSIAYRMPG